MASIIYVHTHRFYSEVLSFFNQFHQLQGHNSIENLYAKMKACYFFPFDAEDN